MSAFIDSMTRQAHALGFTEIRSFVTDDVIVHLDGVEIDIDGLWGICLVKSSTQPCAELQIETGHGDDLTVWWEEGVPSDEPLGVSLARAVAGLRDSLSDSQWSGLLLALPASIHDILVKGGV